MHIQSIETVADVSEYGYRFKHRPSSPTPFAAPLERRIRNPGHALGRKALHDKVSVLARLQMRVSKNLGSLYRSQIAGLLYGHPQMDTQCIESPEHQGSPRQPNDRLLHPPNSALRPLTKVRGVVYAKTPSFLKTFPDDPRRSKTTKSKAGLDGAPSSARLWEGITS